MILITATFIWCWITDQSLLKTHKLSTAIITDVAYSSGRGNTGAILLNYSFKVNGKIIIGTVEFDNSKLNFVDAKSFLIKRSFPVVYSPDYPDNNLLLIREEDFKKFNISFPDSLLWVGKYVKQ